jgi:hypothetical protein
MPNNFYEDQADSQTEGLTSTDKPESDSMDSGEESDNQTALLPKSFFMGKDKRPGDTCCIKVTKAFDDEYQVSYMPDKKGDNMDMEKESPEEDAGENSEEGDMAMADKGKSYYE